MTKELKILTERFSYSEVTSLGRMSFVYIKDYVQKPLKKVKEYFGLTLEDTVRPDNIKVSKYTALPGGLKCKVRIYNSPKRGEVIFFYTEDDLITIKFGLLEWTYVEAHGGNDADDTEGCIIVARNAVDKDHIQGSLQKELVSFIKKKIDEGYEITAEFINHTQTS